MKIDFSAVNERERRSRMPVKPGMHFNRERPIWVTQDGESFFIDELFDEHLQRIERWLRGGGATVPAEHAYKYWYPTISAEMTRRKLPVLPDHPNAYNRHPSSRQDPYAPSDIKIHTFYRRIDTEEQQLEITKEIREEIAERITAATDREIEKALGYYRAYTPPRPRPSTKALIEGSFTIVEDE